MHQLDSFMHQFRPDNVLRASLLLISGYFIARLLSAVSTRGFKKKIRPHQAMLLRRIVFLLVFLLFFASAMQQLEFRISALLGATGILTVAFGIASQTSMSNLISGLFLIGEKPFEIGDYITLGDMSGEIISIDSMSVRIRTSDNTMARIPNETLVKSTFTNLSFFPERRINLTLGVAYETDLNHAMLVLLDVVHNIPLCLRDPAPCVVVQGFAESSVLLQLQVWTQTESRKDLESMLYKAIKEAFAREHISIPYPARALYAGHTREGASVTLHSARHVPA